MYELETVRTWERNPQIYADIIGTSLASQALFAYAPEAERARRVVSKLRQVPRLVQAARDNIKECPGIFVKVGLETWRGVLQVHRERTCRARSRRSTTCTSSATWPTRPPRRPTAINGLHRVSRDRPGAARQGVVPARPRAVRAEAEARRRHHAQRRPAAGDRAARAARSAGGVPHGRRPAAMAAIRSRPGAHAKEQHPEAGHAGRDRAGAGQGARGVPRSGRAIVIAARRPSRWSSRRRRSSTAGRPPACGRRARSRASRAAPTTT